MPAAVLVDIEGTTTALSFVHDVLFPFASRELSGYVRRHSADPEVRAALRATAAEVGRDLSDAEAVEVLLGWIREDRKVTPLKSLQGLVWAEGYADGRLRSHVYDDAAIALRAWHRAGVALYVFSSGSIAAQKLVFGHAPQGDLSVLFAGWFDTTTGPKREPASYGAIARTIGRPAHDVLFLSDVAAELDAAATAGMETTQLRRDGQEPARGHRVVGSFAEIEVRS